MENVKIKLAVLWLVFFCCMITTPILELYIPGFVEDLIAGTIVGEKEVAAMIILTGILTVIPPLMAVLSITLKDKANRWTNIIVGIVWAFLSLVAIGEYLMMQNVAYSGLILIGIVELLVAALITWTAWKWK